MKQLQEAMNLQYTTILYLLLIVLQKVSSIINHLSLLSFLLLPLLPRILGEEVCSHALIGLKPFSYLSNDVSRFSEILTPSDAGACQKVLDETHSDVITPEKERKTVREARERGEKVILPLYCKLKLLREKKSNRLNSNAPQKGEDGFKSSKTSLVIWKMILIKRSSHLIQLQCMKPSPKMVRL